MNTRLLFLAGFLQEHPLAKKYLVVPTYQLGHQMGNVLAQQTENWANLHFVTLPSLAQEVAGAELSGQGIKLVSWTASLFLVDRIFRELKEGGKLGYFGKVEATSGIVRIIRNSVFSLRMAALKSAAISPAHFISQQKGEEIILFLKRYEDEIQKEKKIDMPGLYEIALSKIDLWRRQKGSSQDQEFYLSFQDQGLDHLERRFLEELAGKDLVLIPQDPVYGLVRPRRFWKISGSPSRSFAAPSTPPAANIDRLPWLFAPKEAPAPFPDKSLQIFTAIGPTNECRKILQMIIAEKIPLDEVEIIHPSGAVYPSIMYALAAKNGLKVTYSEGIPLAFTSPGKVFSGLIDWMEHDFLVSDICALIEAGALSLPSGNGAAAISPLKAGRYLKSAMIGWGRERYISRLEILAESAKESGRAAEEEEGSPEKAKKYRDHIEEIERLKRFVAEILAPLPCADDKDKIDFAALCRGFAAVSGKFSCIYGENDAEARAILLSKLDESASYQTAPIERRAAFEWLRSIAAALRVGASGPAPGHIHLSGWRTGGYSGRPMTFFVGLDQGTFPAAGIQDPILLDEERERLSPALVTSADSLRENLWAMAGLLSSLRGREGGRVILSYSSYDVVEERQSFPSSLILQTARLLEGEPSLDYSALVARLPEARGFLPEEKSGEKSSAAVLDEIDWWLARLAPRGELRDGLDSVKSVFSGLSRGIFASEKRDKPIVSEYEGKIRVSSEEVCPLFNQDIVMSASRLELLSRCPFGYFLRYVLDVQKPDELELDASKWLNAMQRGSLLHEIFALFMRELGKRGETVDPKKHEALIHKIGADVVARYKEEIPPPSEGIFERERKAIEQELNVFIGAEGKRPERVEPLLFEISFGRKKRSEESEGMDEPVSLICDPEDQRAFFLAGRIDRIDRISGNHYRVIDYKTGSYSQFEDLKCFGEGRVLQHALYSVAAEEILKKMKIDPAPRVVEGGYSFPTRRGEGKEIIIKEVDRGELGRLLSELMKALKEGRFVVNPEAACDYCDYAPVCGGEAAKDRAKQKKDGNAEVFGFFNNLKKYE
jgi:ATP-dependent helicase/nuclease subunit B